MSSSRCDKEESVHIAFVSLTVSVVSWRSLQLVLLTSIRCRHFWTLAAQTRSTTTSNTSWCSAVSSAHHSPMWALRL